MSARVCWFALVAWMALGCPTKDEAPAGNSAATASTQDVAAGVDQGPALDVTPPADASVGLVPGTSANVTRSGGGGFRVDDPKSTLHGLVLELPPGAIDATEAVVGVEEVPYFAAFLLGPRVSPVLRITPPGVTFKKPVRLRLPVAHAALQSMTPGPRELLLLRNPADGRGAFAAPLLPMEVTSKGAVLVGAGKADAPGTPVSENPGNDAFGGTVDVMVTSTGDLYARAYYLGAARRCTTDAHCADGLVCTQDECVKDMGLCLWTHPVDGTPCDDGNPLTTQDHCTASRCAGLPMECTKNADCDFGNPCTAGACTDGLCQFTPANDGLPCNDNDATTNPDLCRDGACFGNLGECAQVGDCNDKNLCTADECILGACFYTKLDGLVCDDGDPTTMMDVCFNGECSGWGNECQTHADCVAANGCEVGKCLKFGGAATGACTYGTANDGTACSDGDSCTTNDQCKAGLCRGAPKCPGADAACHRTCNLGACGTFSRPTGSACDDADACTLFDTCDATGQCKGVPRDCSDANVCTSQDCAPNGRCVSVIHSSLTCDDGDKCTKDSCNPYTGSCVHEPDPTACCLAKGKACTASDTCCQGQCESGICVPNCAAEGQSCASKACCDGGLCDGGLCVAPAGSLDEAFCKRNQALCGEELASCLASFKTTHATTAGVDCMKNATTCKATSACWSMVLPPG